MSVPTFEYIPVISPPAAAAKLKVVSLAGVVTKHGDTKTDRGRLYASIAFAAGVYTLSLYADRAHASLVAQGTTGATGAYFDLAEANASGISGTAWIDSYSGDESGLILLPTFAVDSDVFFQQPAAASLPGYDEQYGLALHHAAAMREILTSALPAALPYLFGGYGLAAFSPNLAGIELPDLTKLANADQLRVAQASLVKALACEQGEHQPEFKEMAQAARERYDAAIAQLAAANVREQVAEQDFKANTSTVSIGSFTRF